MKTIVAFFISVLVSSILYGQQERRETLDSLWMEALAHNPELAAEQSRAEMVQRHAPQESALADPQLTYKVMEFPGTQLNQATYRNYELMQMVMFPTKLATQHDIAQNRTALARQSVEDKKVDLASRLRTAYAMLWSARKRLGINADMQSLFDQVVQSAHARYAVERETQQEVLNAEIEAEKNKTDAEGLRQEIFAAERMLQALLYRPFSHPIGSVELDSLPPSPPSLERFLSYAVQNNPMILRDSLSILEGSLMFSMAKQNYLPDFTFSIERVTMPMAGMKLWSIEAGISIPFAPWTLGKASSRVQEAEADESMRRSMAQATLSMVTAQTAEAYSELSTAASRLQSIRRSILPKSQQAVASQLTAYRTGQIGYVLLLDALRMYQDMRMEEVMLRMDYERALAVLFRQAGIQYTFDEKDSMP